MRSAFGVIFANPPRGVRFGVAPAAAATSAPRMFMKARTAPEPEPKAKPDAGGKPAAAAAPAAAGGEKKVIAAIAAKNPPGKGAAILEPAGSGAPQDGKTELGKVPSGKPVYASGAETKGYDSKDHAEAGRLHNDASKYHEKLAGEHGEKTKGDDWKVADGHEKDGARHKALAEHHAELAQHHLTAAGRSGSTSVYFTGNQPRFGPVTAHSKEEQAAAAEKLASRTHANHPGGLTDRDKAAYGGRK